MSVIRFDREAAGKRDYERPAVIHTEKLTMSVIACNKADDACRFGGAVQY